MKFCPILEFFLSIKKMFSIQNARFLLFSKHIKSGDNDLKFNYCVFTE